jgi:hypothetical protein
MHQAQCILWKFLLRKDENRFPKAQSQSMYIDRFFLIGKIFCNNAHSGKIEQSKKIARKMRNFGNFLKYFNISVELTENRRFL